MEISNMYVIPIQEIKEVLDKISKDIFAKNFPKLMKDIKPKNEEDIQSPSSVNWENDILKHFRENF